MELEMTQQDRAEVREMLNDILTGYLEKIEGQYRLMTNQLSNIEVQTLKSNNRITHLEDQRDEYLKTRVDKDMLKNIDKKVDDIKEELDILEKEVHEELPHTVSGCPQRDVIMELRDTMITTKALKKTTITTVVITGTIIGVIYSVMMLVLKLIEHGQIPK